MKTVLTTMTRDTELEKIQEFIRNHDVKKGPTAFVSPSVQVRNIFNRQFVHSDVKTRTQYFKKSKK